MCQLQITFYACGHQRKTIFEPCSLARMLGLSTCKHTPSFCPNGLATTRSNAVSIGCSRSHVSGSEYSCADLVILKPFFDHEVIVKEEFEDYNKRLELVVDCLSLAADSGKPECDWSAVPEENLDVSRDMHDIHWNSALPHYVSITRQTFKQAAEHLHIAHKHTVDVMLRCIVSEFPPGLDMRIDTYSLDPENIGLSFYTQIYVRIRDAVRAALQILEITAVVACLDGMGWTLPDQDIEALNGGLLTCIKDRQVKPVYGAINLADYWVPLAETVERDVKVDEEVDPLDTAPWEDPWKMAL